MCGMEDEWISAAEAHKRLFKLHHLRTAEAICSRAADEILVAKAQTLLWGNERFSDKEIPSVFWWARGNTALSQNWQAGDFETWIDSRVHCRAYGVTFHEGDIAAMLPSTRGSRGVDRSAGTNFATARECVAELVEQLKIDPAQVQRHIQRHCRGRLIEGQCDEIWWEVKDRYGPTEYTDQQVAIPAWFWEHCASNPDAILDWQSGTFSGRGSIDGETYSVRIRGAKFDVAGIIDLESLLASESNPKPKQSSDVSNAAPVTKSAEPSGGRRRSENWSDWIAELTAYIHEEGIPAGSGVEGQDSLIAAIDERLRGEGLSRSTVQPVVRAVLKRLRSAGN